MAGGQANAQLGNCLSICLGWLLYSEGPGSFKAEEQVLEKDGSSSCVGNGSSLVMSLGQPAPSMGLVVGD